MIVNKRICLLEGGGQLMVSVLAALKHISFALEFFSTLLKSLRPKGEHGEGEREGEREEGEER